MNINNKTSGFTVAGTDINEVKRKNAQSGMSYNEVKAYIARTTGGHGTRKFSHTNVEAVKQEIQGNKPQS